MVRNLSVSVLAAAAITFGATLGALGLSTAATAQACESPYNDNAGYCTPAVVSNYQDNNWQNNMIWTAVPFSNQSILVPQDRMRNSGWVYTTDEWCNFGTLDFRYLGPRPPRPDRDGVSRHDVVQINYGDYRGFEFSLDGQFRGYV
ncbi:MAG: hypothetical protein JWN75_4 [Candidatus Saccharibacteria bacterium]|nr:hypothetical protein [Candidatus Saccharibacteria bacterium]